MATATDAELILKLYELRREEVLRKARRFLAMEFQPKTFEELMAVVKGTDPEKNAYWRQATSYWEMAASLVLRGALDPDLFFDSNVEGLFLYGKMRQFHEEYEKTMGMSYMRQTAALIERFPAARERYDRMVKQQEARAKVS